MTRYIVIALLAGSLFACNANADNNSTIDVATANGIPTSIVSAFNAAYPNATDVEWDKEDKSIEVEFKINGDKKQINYDFNGRIIKMDD